MSIRLRARTLNSITTASLPSYDRQQVQPGIVHLGPGGFHRAHQAVYTDALLADGDSRWGITGVSLRSSKIPHSLAPQDYLYSVKTLAADAPPAQIIGSLLNAIALQEKDQLPHTLDLLAHQTTHVVSLTITEKGYCADHCGELNLDHPDVAHDLQNPENPRSAPGLLALGLNHRMLAGIGPISILSCDNLSGNGLVTERVVQAMAKQLNPGLPAWLADNVSFPSSMVDRIVPQTSAADLQAFELDYGYHDNALICGEPFTQWVIEDNFRGQRPGWDIAGAQFTSNVAPFEQAKLRLLNATHSALAYLGLLAGYAHVHQAIANPTISAFVQRLLDDEISSEVECPEGMNIADYKTSLLRRFANAAVPYTTLQVAGDGSQKLPQRIFPTIHARLEKQSSVALSCSVVAAWIACLSGTSDSKAAIVVKDPAAPVIAKLSAQHSDPMELSQAIATKTVYLGELASNPEFLRQLGTALTKLRTVGCLAAIGTV